MEKYYKNISLFLILIFLTCLLYVLSQLPSSVQVGGFLKDQHITENIIDNINIILKVSKKRKILTANINRFVQIISYLRSRSNKQILPKYMYASNEVDIQVGKTMDEIHQLKTYIETLLAHQKKVVGDYIKQYEMPGLTEEDASFLKQMINTTQINLWKFESEYASLLAVIYSLESVKSSLISLNHTLQMRFVDPPTYESLPVGALYRAERVTSPDILSSLIKKMKDNG